MNANRVPRRGAFFVVLLSLAMLAACGVGSPEDRMASAKRYLTKNDHQAAVIELKNALQANPKLAEARLLLGVSILELRDAQRA